MKIFAAFVTIIVLSLTGCIIQPPPHCHGPRFHHDCHAPHFVHPPVCHQPCPQPMIIWGPGCSPAATPKPE